MADCIGTSRKPFEYQERGITDIAKKFASGTHSIIFQLSTGGGKTVIMATIIQRYLSKNPAKKVIVMVHREELMKQVRNTLYEWYGIISQPIGCNAAPQNAQVYIAMVETMNNRVKKPQLAFLLSTIGLTIIDECHIGNFKKLIGHFPHSLLLGFTATPLSASKKDPLKNYYEAIICGIDIPELISLNQRDPTQGLVQNHTYSIPHNLDRESLHITSTGEFDNRELGEQLRKPKQVHNTIANYERLALGTKTLVFNANIEHSEIMNKAWIDAGYNSRHLDSECGIEYRHETLNWLRSTSDAILNNIGILTTGFDERTIQTIIPNTATMSLPLWLQMCGRGSRPFPGKSFFTIIDMGGNALAHGDWCDPRDWSDLFYNPPVARKKKQGVPRVKDCPQCMRILPIAATQCPECGHVFEKVQFTSDTRGLNLVLVTKGLDLKQLMQQYQHKSQYFTYIYIMDNTVYEAHRANVMIDDFVATEMLMQCFMKCKEWCKLNGRAFNIWHRNFAREKLVEALGRLYSWKPAESNEAFIMEENSALTISAQSQQP